MSKEIIVDGLDKLKKNIGDVKEYLTDLDGKEMDLGKEKIFLQGGNRYLHTSRESAEFELNNQMFFDFIRSISEDIERKLKQ